MNTITVGTYEAKTNLAHLLSRVAKGVDVIITKHERPVARLSPITPSVRSSREEALRRIEAIAAQVKPGPDTMKDLINAGRRI